MSFIIDTRIRDTRNRLGWSQTALAKRMQVSVKTVKNWENGMSEPSAKHIAALSKLFAVTADYLLGLQQNAHISLDGLKPKDREILLAMVQVYISKSKGVRD